MKAILEFAVWEPESMTPARGLVRVHELNLFTAAEAIEVVREVRDGRRGSRRLGDLTAELVTLDMRLASGQSASTLVRRINFVQKALFS